MSELQYVVVGYIGDKHQDLGVFETAEEAIEVAKNYAMASAFVGADACYEVDYAPTGSKQRYAMPDGDEMAFYCASDFAFLF